MEPGFQDVSFRLLGFYKIEKSTDKPIFILILLKIAEPILKKS